MPTMVNILGGSIEDVFHNIFRFRHETRTLAGAVVLTTQSPTLQFMDPGGATRTVTLPAEALSAGLFFIISNEADGAGEILTIQDDTPTTIVTPTQNEACIVFCNGITWSGLVGATS